MEDISENVDVGNPNRPQPVENDDLSDFSDLSEVTTQSLMNIFNY